MAPITRIERRLAHQAVHTGLGAQPAIGVLALYRDAGALDAGDFPGTAVDDFTGEAARSAPAQVHSQQHLRPVLRLGAARPRLDIEEGAVRVHRAAKHALEFQPPYAGFECIGFLLDVARRGFVVFALRKLEQLGRVADGGVGAIEFLELCRKPRALFPELLGTLRRAPDSRVFEFAAYFFEAFFFAVVLK